MVKMLELSAIVLMIGIISPFFLDTNLLYHLPAQIFLSFGIMTWGLLFIVITKSPAGAFFETMGGGKMILFNPKANKYATFQVAERKGSLSYVKGQGYYVINPNHVYIESISKTPIAIVQDNFALSMDVKTDVLVAELQKMGIENYDDLIKQYVYLKDKMENDKEPAFMLNGETITFANVINYFGSNERSDWIEVEIDRRTVAEAMKKAGMGTDFMKWAAFIALIIVAGVLAFVMIQSQTGGTVNASDLSKLVAGLSATKVVNNPAITTALT